MIAILEKYEHNADFHQIVDFVEASHLRQYTRRARIAQSSALPTVANDPASPFGNDSQGEACPTIFGLEAEQDRANIIKTSTFPYDSPPRVTSLAADEGTQDLEIASLKARNKMLEDKDGERVEPSGEDATIKGRSLETGEEAGIERSTDKGTTMATPYSRKKVKEKMVESDTPQKKKLQEQIDVQDSAKKVKTLEEVSEEDLKAMMQLVPVEEVYVEALQLWELVKETLNIRQATKWRLYDSCGVHHVLSGDQEIFMLVERDYPLRKGIAIVMISNKLQVENYSQMVNDLILKIHQIANSLRQRGIPTASDEFPLPEDFPTVSEERFPLLRKRIRLKRDKSKQKRTRLDKNGKHCGVLSEADHCQPPQYTVNHLIFNAHNDFLNSQNELTIAQNKLMKQMTSLTSLCEMACQIIQKNQEEKQIKEEQAANARYWKISTCCNDDDDYNFAITPNEPVDSLSMGDEPFSNVLFDAEYEFDSVDYQSCSDEDFLEEIFLNPLFEEEIIPMKIDQHHFSAESDLIESVLNHDSSIIPSSLKIDSLLDEFADELILLKSIPPGINKIDCYHEDKICFTRRLLYDNSSPRPPEEFVSENSNADIESFSPSPILIKDSDSRLEEIDLTFTPDDPMPPSIEEDDYDSKRDILICEELLDNYSLSLPVNESFHFDTPSFSHPPAKPPD
nr:hypothetical protein [Tanacetum cinerariifolium]